MFFFRSLKIIPVIAVLLCYGLKLNAQKEKYPKIKLPLFLSKLSEKHQVFFTYDPDFINDIEIKDKNIFDEDLEIIVDDLRVQTKLNFDNLGNNYYVIYNNSAQGKVALEKAKKRLNVTIASISESKTNYQFNVRGRVIDQFDKPISDANIIQNGSLNGTVTDQQGRFLLPVTSFNNVSVSVSCIGYSKKVVVIKGEKDVTIRLKLGESLNEIQIVGSRNFNRSKLDTSSAIDIVQLEEAITKTGQIEINQILQYVIPSFNASKQSGADGADHVVPATLRGLGPDQTLILINGKRRHQTSLINLYGTRGRGNSGTDLNAIPASAIEKIEVLRDGASAQYGSDAIAGVINIVLKDDVDAFNGSVTYGFNNANANGDYENNSSGIDGHTLKLSGNYGVKILEKGFLNITTEYLSKDKTLRPGAEFREKYGESGLDEYSVFLNAVVPLNENSSFYAFGGYSFRDSESYAFTRFADNARNVIDIYPNGFNPLITAQIKDNSISAGYRTRLKGWNIDINNTFGKNNFQYYIKETLNATLLFNSPTSFNAGGHILSQNTTGVDFNRFYSDVLSGVNIAFGTEYRMEKYEIFAGEEGSYAAYDINDNVVDQNTPSSDLKRLNGFVRPRGSQGFPGYAPENEVDQTRSNLALYVDTEFDFSEKLMFGVAGRYEKYSDFGNTFNVKLSSRYKSSSNFNLRSSFSSGFRAPSLAQIYYNLKFTNFVGSEASESLLELNNSPITRSFGIGELIEEKAINGSIGFTSKIKNFRVTADAYYVKIKDRIILTGDFDATTLDANVNFVQFFANGVNTSTLGMDVVFTWQKKIGDNNFLVSFAGNFNSMKIDDFLNKGLDEETFFGKRNQAFLLASAPKSKLNLNFNYSNSKFNANLTLTSFSKVSLIDWQIYSPLSSEDPSSEYVNETDRLQKATDNYDAKLTTDINLGYAFNKRVSLRLGANNIFNIYPTDQENEWTDGGGNWDSVQMGTNGSFFYSNISYKF